MYLVWYTSELEWALGRAHTFAITRLSIELWNLLALVACQLDTNWPCYGKKKILTFSWPWPWPERSQNRIKWSPDNNQSSHQISCISKKILTFSWPWPLTRNIPKSNQMVPGYPTKYHAIRFNTFWLMRITHIQINTRRSKHNLPHFQCEGNEGCVLNVESLWLHIQGHGLMKTFLKRHSYSEAISSRSWTEKSDSNSNHFSFRRDLLSVIFLFRLWAPCWFSIIQLIRSNFSFPPRHLWCKQHRHISRKTFLFPVTLKTMFNIL